MSRASLPLTAALPALLLSSAACEGPPEHPGRCPPVLAVQTSEEVQRTDAITLSGSTSHPCDRAVVSVAGQGVEARSAGGDADPSLATWTLEIPRSLLPEPSEEGTAGDGDAGSDGDSGSPEDTGAAAAEDTAAPPEGLPAWTVQLVATDVLGDRSVQEARVLLDPTPSLHADDLHLVLVDGSGASLSAIPADGSQAAWLQIWSSDPFARGASVSLSSAGDAATLADAAVVLLPVEEGEALVDLAPEAAVGARTAVLVSAAGTATLQALATGGSAEVTSLEVVSGPVISADLAQPEADATVYLSAASRGRLASCGLRGGPAYASLVAAAEGVDPAELSEEPPPVDLVLTLEDAPEGAAVRVDCTDTWGQVGSLELTVAAD